uniref:Zinc finger CCHC-type and RNA-binding motif-containing protein 1 n=1 Tax=Oryctolagus cuniculus TaxID=9986 RepID=A0A5F9DG00_RABIT
MILTEMLNVCSFVSDIFQVWQSCKIVLDLVSAVSSQLAHRGPVLLHLWNLLSLQNALLTLLWAPLRGPQVTIMKDKDTRKSKGVAFILFLDKDSAQNCTRAINNKQLFGRVIKASIAIDNGRAAEFIRRRNYFDKSKCYECGESGHLSYACPKNMLGEREPPKKKEKKKKKKVPEPEEEMYVYNYFSKPDFVLVLSFPLGDCILTLLQSLSEEVEESEDEGEDPALDSLSQAIAFQVLSCSLPGSWAAAMRCCCFLACFPDCLHRQPLSFPHLLTCRRQGLSLQSRAA